MTPAENPLIYVVDNDAALHCTLRGLLDSVGLVVRAFADLDAFMAAYQADQPGCLLLNDGLPGHGGLSAQQRLSASGIEVPVIIMADYGDVATAVTAMKRGALDFVVKPFNEQLLLDSIHQAVAEDRVRRRNRVWRQDLQRRFDTLTRREQDVLRWIAAGLSSHEIAEMLQLSRKTVEVHRARVMHKMDTHILSQLIRMAMTLGIVPPYQPEP